MIKKNFVDISILILALGIGIFILKWFIIWLGLDMTIVPRESQVVNSPEIQPFLAGRIGFRGIRLNMDANEVLFAFPTIFKNAESYFDAIHLAAKSNGWELQETAPFKRIYKQRFKNPNTILKITTTSKVTLLYNPNNSEVTFHLEEI